jgi:Ca2+-binding RTX toxin-like protein
MGNSVQTANIAQEDILAQGPNTTQVHNILANDQGSGHSITHINNKAVVPGDTVTLNTGEQVTLNADGTITVTTDGDIGSNTLTYSTVDSAGNPATGFITIETTTTPPDFIVEGTAGADLIDAGYTGDPEGDMIDNNDAADGSNDDLVFAGAGNDTVFAGNGNDTVFGEEGNDSILGLGGNDVIYGNQTETAPVTVVNGDFSSAGTGWTITGAGTFVYNVAGDPAMAFNASNREAGGSIEQTVTTQAGRDYELTLDALEHDGFGGVGDHTLVIEVIDSNGTVIASQTQVITDESSQTITVAFTSTTDDVTLRFSNPSSTATIDTDLRIDNITVTPVAPTGPDDDTIEGGAGDDFIDGGIGADSILGGTGNDEILGGDGDDRVFGQDGSDTILGGAGNDTLDGDDADATGAADSISGGDGDDQLIGDVGNDTLSGDAGNDSIFAGADDDLIAGGTGSDVMFGEGGDDTFILEDGFGADTIIGGETGEVAGDTLDLSAITGPFFVDLTAANPEAGSVSDGTYTATFSEIENILLGGGTETLILGDGSGSDTVQGFAAPIDNGDGTFTGGDQLDVSGLTDAGGAPVNVFDVTVTDTNGDGTGDAILTFPNGENLTLIGVSPAAVSTPAALAAMGIPDNRNFIVEGTNGNDLIDAGYTGDPQGDRIDANDAANGSNDDIVFAGFGDDTVLGGAGNDEIHGEDGNDSVDGGAGDDSLNGGFDDDSLLGGEGNDTLSGDYPVGGVAVADGDTITGTAGQDSFVFDGAPGSTATIILDGGTGTANDGDDLRDTVFVNETGDGATLTIEGFDYTVDWIATPEAWASSTVIESAPGNHLVTLTYANGNTQNFDIFHDNGSVFVVDDAFAVHAGNDTIEGGAGDDLIFGVGGDDLLLGGAGNDTLGGEDGDDTLDGGTEADTLLGGAGADTFFLSQGDSADGGDGDDIFILTDLGETDTGTITIIGGEGDETDGDTLILTPEIGRGDITFTNPDDTAGGLSGTFTFNGVVVNFSKIENIICFTPGARILTPRGERPVETLRPGDLVVTRDHGPQRVRWTGRRTVPGKDRFAPVEIAPSVMGGSGLIVSPHHRVLFTGYKAELLFGEREVLVAAKHLVNGRDVRFSPCAEVTYVHVMFDRHEVIYADGIATESFFAGDTALSAVDDAAREELFAIFPELRSAPGRHRETARTCLKAREAALLQDLCIWDI